jgi:hypothetical protein
MELFHEEISMRKSSSLLELATPKGWTKLGSPLSTPAD